VNAIKINQNKTVFQSKADHPQTLYIDKVLLP